MKLKPPSCDGCPARRIGKGYVPPRGPANATIAIIGQGPGETEAYVGTPFTGPSGQTLNRWLSKAYIDHNKCFIDNIVRCWLPLNRKPTKAEMDFCTKAHTFPTLCQLPNLKVVVPCGVPAMQMLLDPKAGEHTAGVITKMEITPDGTRTRVQENSRARDQSPSTDQVSRTNLPGHRPTSPKGECSLPNQRPNPRADQDPNQTGKPRAHNGQATERLQQALPEHRDNKLPAVRSPSSRGPVQLSYVRDSTAITIVPILHPAFIMRGKWAMGPIQSLYLKKAKDIADGFPYQELNLSIPPKNVLLDPTLAEIDTFIDHIGTGPIAIDIESAGSHLVCIGFLKLSDESYICIHWRGLKGKLHWETEADQHQAIIYMDMILADPQISKIFHNGQAFDIPMLEAMGFEVNGYSFDTIIAAHLAYAELPKRLEFLASVYANFPHWKKLVAKTEEHEDK